MNPKNACTSSNLEEPNPLGNTHRAEDELVKHAGYEESPVDVQQLKNHQHHVEEVVSKEGRIVVQRVHPSTVDQPTQDTRVLIPQTDANLAISCTYQKGKMIILETIKTTVKTTKTALAARCHLA